MAYAADPAAAVARSRLSARTTHGAPQAIDATGYFGGLIAGALNGVAAESLLGPDQYLPHPGAWDDPLVNNEVANVASGSFLEKEPPEIRGRGYVIGALEAALWAVSRNDDFRSAVLAAVNLGEDADTTAAIVGQLAGAIHGASGIPAEWRERVHLGDEIAGLADQLLELSEAIDPEAEDVE